MKSFKFLIPVLILFMSLSSFGQQIALPFEQGLRQAQEKGLLQSGDLHSVWPLVVSGKADTINYHDLKPMSGKFGNTWLGRKLFTESLITVKNPDFNLAIDPLVGFEAGRDSRKDDITWLNTRGFRGKGSIGEKFSFYTAFYESQAVFPTWVDSITRSLAVVPGQAFTKNFKDLGFDFAFAEGHFIYSPLKYFDFRFGHGKNFIGDGYRSLLLSDAAFNYPYLMINTKVWNLQYTNLYAQFQELTKSGGSWTPWNKKYATMHHLSWNVTEWFNISIFEAVVWQAADSTGPRGFEVNYLNPVIFYRPVEFSLSSPDNVLMGGSMRFTINKKYLIFAQFMLDEFKLEHVRKGDGWWANKHGFQIGAKAFDLFNIPNLYVQAEYNHVRPYTYAHNVSLQNYGHYNQPLAHPKGANFRETVFIASYRKQRLMLDYKLIAGTFGADTSGLNFGGDIFKSYNTYVYEFGNKIGQGLKTRLIQHDFKASWLVNPATNLQLSAGISLRNENSTKSERQTTFLWFGLRSALFNRYYDW